MLQWHFKNTHVCVGIAGGRERRPGRGGGTDDLNTRPAEGDVTVAWGDRQRVPLSRWGKVPSTYHTRLGSGNRYPRKLQAPPPTWPGNLLPKTVSLACDVFGLWHPKALSLSCAVKGATGTGTGAELILWFHIGLLSF